MPSKVAVAVFVKNEYPDFCAWLAWYLALGVDTILVFDDHSTDGTWEAALAASRRFDVRAFRSDLSVQPFTARQRDIYLDAASRFADEFDWIGFFDADEYLHLRGDAGVPAFLDRFPDAAAVAISWCIYGSSGHLLKPKATTVEAFTRHALPEFGHNRSVKSFVRPKLMRRHWRDPHTFDVGDLPYVDPQGNPVQWGGPGGISHDPDWSVAKLMHFIPRSMEHFIERIRRRSDLRGLTNEYWGVFDKNDLDDPEPLDRLPEANRVLFAIDQEILGELVRRLAAGRAGAEAPRPEVTPDGPGAPQGSLLMVGTSFGTVLAADGRGRLVHVAETAIAGSGCTPVLALLPESATHSVHLFAPMLEGPLQVRHDWRVTDLLSYRLEHDPETRSIHLIVPDSGRFLTAIDPGGAPFGATAADRHAASSWECFSLLRPDQPLAIPRHLAALAALGTDQPDADSLLAAAASGAGPSVCACLMQLMPAEQRLAAVPAGCLRPAWL